jgi:hypothetical protein
MQNIPGLLDGIRNDINLFLEALKPFERNQTYDGNLLRNFISDGL